jgi:hypothetical protein
MTASTERKTNLQGSGRRTALGFVHAFRRGGEFFQLGSRADWPQLKVTAAVRANTVQFCVSTVAAERALKGADHSVNRSRREILAAAFAVRSELEHVVSSYTANVLLYSPFRYIVRFA